jgi:hypothetical protein
VTLLHPHRLLRLAGILAAAALVIGGCSRSGRIDSLSGPGRTGIRPGVSAGCPTLNGNTLNTADQLNTESGSVPQFRTGRLRIEVAGDIAVPSIASMGACAAADIPSINFLGGHANVFLSGTTTSVTTSGNRLTFGPLLFGGANAEPGTVIASDAEGNVLQIIWPDLAGIGAGSPRFRLQLARWNAALVTPSSQLDVTFDVTAEQDGVQQTVKGGCQGMPMNGAVVSLGGGNIAPCPGTLGNGGNVKNVSAGIVQFRSQRLRVEVTGDVAGNVLLGAGACAATDGATIQFTGGTANMMRGGSGTSVTTSGNSLSFGPLAFPGVALEPGVVLAQDSNKNVLEVIWPGLAGLPPGPPIFRFQQTKWNSWVQTGRQVDVSMRLDAVGPDGHAASFSVSAKGLVVPQMK